MSNSNSFRSSIWRKIPMALTGLFLVSFLVVHVSINSLIFLNDSGVTFNAAAHFMSHNIVIRIMEIGLFAGLFWHMIQALIITLKNRKARPIGYSVTNGKANSTWYSRSMGILGSLLLIFLVVHLANFWWPTKAAVFAGEEHNTFENMKAVFEKWYFVAVYMVGVVSLAYHLMHGFKSAFQTLGLNHPKYNPTISFIGTAFSIFVPLLFAAMPITMHLGLIK